MTGPESKPPDPNEYRIPSGGELRIMRMVIGLTQQQVADDAGIHERTVRAVENGQANLESTGKVLAVLQDYGVGGVPE